MTKLGCVMVLAAISAGARADGIQFANGTGTYVRLCSQTNPTAGATAACSENYGNNRLAMSSSSGTVGAGRISESGTAKAQGGILGAATSVTLTNYSASNVTAVPGQEMPSLAEAQANWIDTVRFTGTPATYNLTFTFSLDGSITSNNPYFQSYAGIGLDLIFDPSGRAAIKSTTLDGRLYSNRPTPTTITLSYNNLTQSYFQEFLTLYTITSIPTLPYAGANTSSITGAESANFANTLKLQSLTFTDAAGNPISGITATSETGYQYTIDGASPVPEPSTLVFGLTGLMALAMWKRRELSSFVRGL